MVKEFRIFWRLLFVFLGSLMGSIVGVFLGFSLYSQTGISLSESLPNHEGLAVFGGLFGGAILSFLMSYLFFRPQVKEKNKNVIGIILGVIFFALCLLNGSLLVFLVTDKFGYIPTFCVIYLPTLIYFLFVTTKKKQVLIFSFLSVCVGIILLSTFVQLDKNVKNINNSYLMHEDNIIEWGL